MLLAIALNLASAVVLVGGWALAVRALYNGLEALATGRDLPRLPATDRPHDAAPMKRAA